MNKKLHRFFTGPLLPASLLSLVFFFSLFFVLLFQTSYTGRFFFFPVFRQEKIAFERRNIPRRKNLEEQLENFLDELLLGPLSFDLAALFPRGTKWQHVALVDHKVYLDLNTTPIDSKEYEQSNFKHALDYVRQNIAFNFPQIEEIIFTVDGQQVGGAYYRDNSLLFF